MVMQVALMYCCEKGRRAHAGAGGLSLVARFAGKAYLAMASSTATATETVAPTMGLLPMPRKPIIST